MGVIVFYVATPTGQVVSSTGGEQDEFASCLTNNEAIFYGTEWCGACNYQKAMFGESMHLVDFVDCDQNRELCRDEGIRAYPTWKINGQPHVGVQSLEKLATLAGCDLSV